MDSEDLRTCERRKRDRSSLNVLIDAIYATRIPLPLSLTSARRLSFGLPQSCMLLASNQTRSFLPSHSRRSASCSHIGSAPARPTLRKPAVTKGSSRANSRSTM